MSEQRTWQDDVALVKTSSPKEQLAFFQTMIEANPYIEDGDMPQGRLSEIFADWITERRRRPPFAEKDPLDWPPVKHPNSPLRRLIRGYDV